jgi:DNA-binding SARP family transcriptional activator
MKSADLLRLLALSSGKPVAVPGLLDKFWPEVEVPRAKASLRTALTHIRGAIGRESVVRSKSGLVLGNAWAYRLLAGEARQCVRTGRHADLVRLARESESLYTADFEAHDDDAPWAIGARESLIDLRKGLLSDAAESAVELRWFRDAVDFAESAITVDPGLERAHRALMRAYAGLGETERALRAFDNCRHNLATELGADPSPLTASVHLQILSGPVPSFPDGRLVGRDEEVAALASELRTAAYTGGPTIVRVTGEPGSGRDAVLDRAIHDLGSQQRRRIVVCPSEEQSVYAARNVQVALAAGPDDGNVATVVVTPAPPTSAAARGSDLDAAGVQVREVSVGPMAAADIGELASTVLAGPVSRTLVHRLEHDSEGRAGDAVRLLRTWAARGSIVWTSAGLEVVSSDAGWEEEHSFARVLRELQRQMSYPKIALMQTLALLARPVTAAELAPLHEADDRDSEDAADAGSGSDSLSRIDEVQVLLDQLSDEGVLRVGHRGHEFRHPGLRDATTAWMRPSARHRLYRRLVEAGLLTDEVRETA